jgi:diadenosine tetraphosphatase ApaH/serine/threonine PP2A family protein phosphatase
MADIEEKKVDKIFCLGDVVGYGPSPAEVIDVAIFFDVCLRGNHDQAVVSRIPKRFKKLAAKAVFWTRKLLKPQQFSTIAQRQRWQFLKNLPVVAKYGDMLFAHGTPAHTFEYLDDKELAGEVFDSDMKGKNVLFVGHTHIPGCFVEGKRIRRFVGEPGMKYQIGRQRLIVNVGSVGQPRDGDPRACWVLLRDDSSFSFRRVEYNIEETVRKIRKIPNLANSLGERLLEGE